VEQSAAQGCVFYLIWLAWVVVNVIAYLIAGGVGEAIETAIAQPGSDAERLLSIEGRVEQADLLVFLAAVVAGIVAGVIIGIAQGLVLFPYLKMKGVLEWIGATTLGWAVRWVALFVISQQLVRIVVDRNLEGTCFLFALLIGIGVIAGATLGYAQSLVLRRRVDRANWWVWANIPGPVAASLLVGMGLYIESQNILRDWTGLIGAIVGAAATGIALTDLLRHPTKYAEWYERMQRKPQRYVQPAVDTVLGSTLYEPRKPNPPDDTRPT
jgi:hypothetical protein